MPKGQESPLDRGRMDSCSRENTELLLRIFADVRPSGIAEGAYLYAETQPNQQSVFAAGRELIEQKLVRKLLISNCTPKSGYIGATAYRAAMVEAGISNDVIEEVPMEPTEILHTGIEADKAVRFAKARNYKRLFVVSVPFHQERAFISVVTAVLREYPSLKVYSHPGEAQPWDEIVTHSQGKLRGTRAELIAEELKRIETYTAQGHLLPRSTILNYLRARD
ncbi:MAG: YdcF family protein [Solirubrobacterales bacterium]